MPRKDFVDSLRSIAARHGLEFQALSHDWIIQIRSSKRRRVCSVFGYTFDVNGAAAAEICKEKAATSMVLTQAGVANIPHHVFLSPTNEFTSDYVPLVGNWMKVRETIEAMGGLPVVMKPLKGTGGYGVVKANNWREVEAAVQKLFGMEYGLAVSPYKEVKDEYRCICLEDKVEFVYRKVRNHISGDGSSTVAALVGQALAQATPQEVKALTRDVAELSAAELSEVPEKGQSVALQWKHNLGLGARVELNVAPEVRGRLDKLALAAAAAVGARFCSVDVAEVESEGLMVMEINGGVMMDSLIGQLGDEGKALAERVYERAVMLALGEDSQPS